MKTRKQMPEPRLVFPDAGALAALRAWYEGASSRQVAERYLRERLDDGRSARGVIGQVRQQLALYAFTGSVPT